MHEFVQNGGLNCYVEMPESLDENYTNLVEILRAYSLWNTVERVFFAPVTFSRFSRFSKNKTARKWNITYDKSKWNGNRESWNARIFKPKITWIVEILRAYSLRNVLENVRLFRTLFNANVREFEPRVSGEKRDKQNVPNTRMPEFTVKNA